jgi:hypothetical protein
MKKNIIIASLFCLSSNLLIAQKFNIGLKAGANFTKIEGVAIKQEYKLNYHAGAFIELDFNKKIGIQPEVLFSQYEAQIVTSSTITPPNANYKINYLNIPVLLRYKIGKILVLNVGPQYSILLNSNDNLVSSGTKAFKDGDFGMIGGLQLGFKFLRVYARYNIGLNNINDISSSNNWKSQQIQAGVGFRF